MSETSKHIEELTWLRGLAAFFVVVNHTVLATNVVYFQGDRPADIQIFNTLALGKYGVCLFFVLSGMTLYVSNNKISSFTEVSGFYIKRFFRIWPAFVVSLLIYILFNLFFVEHYEISNGYWIEQHLNEFSLVNIFQYLSMTFNITGPENLFNGAYWSLPVEFQYYLVFPLVLVLMRLFGPVAVILLGGIFFIAGVGRFIDVNDQKIFLLAWTFFAGMLIGHFRSTIGQVLPTWLSILILLALVGIVSAIANEVIRMPDIPILGSQGNYYALLAILTVLVVVKSNFQWLHPKVKSIARTYGDISYSTYLFHQVFIGISVLVIMNFNIEGNYKLLITFVFTLVSTWYWANITYSFVEKPFISYSKKITKKYLAKNDRV